LYCFVFYFRFIFRKLNKYTTDQLFSQLAPRVTLIITSLGSAFFDYFSDWHFPPYTRDNQLRALFVSSIFTELGGMVVVAAGLATLVRAFKLPPLIGYIAAGVALGPLGLNFIHGDDFITTLTELGIAFLLFLVGLELDWGKSKHQFKAATSLGVIQASSYFLAGLLLAFAGGQDILTGVYIGVALAFASTVVIVKFLTEARDMNSLHGRLAIGILLIEDVIAIIALVLIAGLSGSSALAIGQQIFFLLVKTAAMLALIWVLARHVFPYIFGKIAKSAELLFITSIAWCFLFSLTMLQFNFPVEIGAFMAGISLASLPYNLDIMTRLRSLRDFFLVIFFVTLGSHVAVPTLNYGLLTAGMVVLIVIGKPIISFLTLVAHHYRARTSFLTAVTQSQISEFSLIIVTLGFKQGHIAGELVSAITLAMLLSIFFSTILFGQRNRLFHLLKKPLTALERHSHAHHERVTDELETRLNDHIVIFGYHRMGYHILKKLHEMNHHTVVVDFNPDIVRKLRSAGIDSMYGDVEDEELFEAIHIDKASMVVSTIPHHEETLFLIEQIKKNRRSKTKLIVTSNEIDNALEYYAKGADYVILPHLLGGEHVADLITQYQSHSLGRYMRHRAEEIKLLRAKNHALYFD
jgi:Kef-type K+ transport system membrane component KefB